MVFIRKYDTAAVVSIIKDAKQTATETATQSKNGTHDNKMNIRNFIASE